ncbi:unnamed protein product [Rhizoctonia solani]|uniref:Transmembrane protein 53 n=1 Tax=Rhizoctonia solani TaxID=456999 RepID=A0A8H3DMJ4_9AGAM|nr:unnamed protein product [Rhizoctonia solani]
MRTFITQHGRALYMVKCCGRNSTNNIIASRITGHFLDAQSRTLHHSASSMSATSSSTPSKAVSQRVFIRLDDSDVYVSHPTEAEKRKDADHAKAKAPPVILLFGWMDAQLQHLYKYTEQYNKIYPGATQILVRTHQTHFWKSESANRASVFPVIKLLRDAGISEHTTAEKSGLLVHTFSNGGALSQNTLARAIAGSLPSNATTSALPAQAFIYDSLPGILDLRITTMAFTALIRSPALRSLAKPVAGLIYILGSVWRHTFGLVFGQKEDMFAQLHRELNEPRLLPQNVPRTYIYSDVDEIIPSSSVEGHAKKARELIGEGAGSELVRLVKFEGSMHVAHARQDGRRYWGEVMRTWEISYQ